MTEIPQLKKLKINRFFLLVGSLLPDIVDKPLFLFGFGNGRFFSHNLLFLIISFSIVYLSSKRNKYISFSFLTGLIIHIILDIPHVPLFYPFISYEFTYLEDPLQNWVLTLLKNPFILITEIMGFLFVIFILVKYKLYHIKDIMNYLKGNNQILTQNSKIINSNN